MRTGRAPYAETAKRDIELTPVVGTTFFFELATYVTNLLWKTPPCRKTEVTSFLVVVLY